METRRRSRGFEKRAGYAECSRDRARVDCACARAGLAETAALVRRTTVCVQCRVKASLLIGAVDSKPHSRRRREQLCRARYDAMSANHDSCCPNHLAARSTARLQYSLDKHASRARCEKPSRLLSPRCIARIPSRAQRSTSLTTPSSLTLHDRTQLGYWHAPSCHRSRSVNYLCRFQTIIHCASDFTSEMATSVVFCNHRMWCNFDLKQDATLHLTTTR